MKNGEVAKILYEIGQYLEMENVPFKPRAYEKAAAAVESLEEDVAELYKKGGLKALEEIPGVGASIGAKIEEYLKHGTVEAWKRLRKKYPVAVGELSGVEGIGPKMALKLYRKLGIKNLSQLEAAARAGKIEKIAGFGAKSEENILKGIEFRKKSGGRFVLGFVLPELRDVAKRLGGVTGVEKAVVAGSARRFKETIGDVDFLVVSRRPKPVADYFVSMPEVVAVHAHGETRSSVKLRNGLNADLRVVPPESFGAALNYFTGSKEHNVALREIAIQKGYKLNEYGLFKGTRQRAGRTEEDVYRALGLSYIEPELRENAGEIEAARRRALPHLVGYGDIRGDLQVQTDWTDGKNSICEMVEAARRLGRDYIAITDHTRSLAMTGGADEKKLLKQMAEIDRLNRALGGRPKILKGAEVNILKDGTLDIADAVLAKLDVVGAAVHSHFTMARGDMTRRIARAMESSHVDILFHPTGRVINRRPPYEVDVKEIVARAKKTGTVLEIDAYPDRMDLKDEHVRLAVDAGVKLTIDTDAHATAHLSYTELGVATARRGWAGKKNVINAWPLKKMLSFLK